MTIFEFCCGSPQATQGHSSHEEEDDLGDLRDVVAELAKVSFKRCGTHDEVEGPAEGSGEKSCRRLVDLEGMFEDDD